MNHPKIAGTRLEFERWGPEPVRTGLGVSLARGAAVLAGAALFCVVGWPVLAQGPPLHEQVFGLEDGAVIRFTRSVLGAGGASDSEANPPTGEELLMQGGVLIPKPTGAAAGHTPLRSDSGGLGQDRGRGDTPRFRPDRITSFGSEANYYSSFAPSVSPHKRLSALDAVVMDGNVPVLVVGDGSRTVVPLTDGDGDVSGVGSRDRFWGTVNLDFRDGPAVPIPSVAPTARILALETDPVVPLRIEKDTADNFFAVLEDGEDFERLASVRLTFLTDAPVEYFNAARISETPTGILADRVAPLPVRLRRRATRFLKELGLETGVPYRKALDVLTEHFRSFRESEESPAEGESIYLDLARSGRGVCRHRAYAFVISAMQLGIPARFLMNEAHAWVEVEVPETGWLRIDLGGAVTDFKDRNPSARVHYQSRFEDPLPRPLAYREALARAAGNAPAGTRFGASETTGGGASGGAGAGASSDGVSSDEPSTDAPLASRTEGSGGEGPSKLVAGQNDRTAVTPAAVTHLDFSADAAGGTAEGEGVSVETGEAEEPLRVPLRLLLSSARHTAFRGQTLELAGRAVAPPQAQRPNGLRIEVTLLQPGTGRTWPLGVTVTGPDGEFSGSFGVPPELAVGSYRIRVRSAGSALFFPAEAR